MQILYIIYPVVFIHSVRNDRGHYRNLPLMIFTIPTPCKPQCVLLHYIAFWPFQNSHSWLDQTHLGHPLYCLHLGQRQFKFARGPSSRLIVSSVVLCHGLKSFYCEFNECVNMKTSS